MYWSFLEAMRDALRLVGGGGGDGAGSYCALLIDWRSHGRSAHDAGAHTTELFGEARTRWFLRTLFAGVVQVPNESSGIG